MKFSAQKTGKIALILKVAMAAAGRHQGQNECEHILGNISYARSHGFRVAMVFSCLLFMWDAFNCFSQVFWGFSR